MKVVKLQNGKHNKFLRVTDVLVGGWRFILRRKKQILCQCGGSLPEHEAEHTVLALYNGSPHAQHNSNFVLYFTKFNYL
jgi:hypothetical protein